MTVGSGVEGGKHTPIARIGNALFTLRRAFISAGSSENCECPVGGGGLLDGRPFPFYLDGSTAP